MENVRQIAAVFGHTMASQWWIFPQDPGKTAVMDGHLCHIFTIFTDFNLISNSLFSLPGNISSKDVVKRGEMGENITHKLLRDSFYLLLNTLFTKHPIEPLKILFRIRSCCPSVSGLNWKLVVGVKFVILTIFSLEISNHRQFLFFFSKKKTQQRNNIFFPQP